MSAALQSILALVNKAQREARNLQNGHDGRMAYEHMADALSPLLDALEVEITIVERERAYHEGEHLRRVESVERLSEQRDAAQTRAEQAERALAALRVAATNILESHDATCPGEGCPISGVDLLRYALASLPPPATPETEA